VRFCKKPSA